MKLSVGGIIMKFKNVCRLFGTVLSVMMLCVAMTGEAAQNEVGLLADGELFVADRVNAGAKVLYDGKLDKAQWALPQGTAVPQGFGCAAFVYGKNLPQTVSIDNNATISKAADMIQVARTKYAVAANANSLVVYVTTGPSAAETDLAISSVKLYGRLLNVVVAMKNPNAIQKNTMNTMFPEKTVAIPLKKLPRYGNLRLRFADTNGQALANQEILLAR